MELTLLLINMVFIGGGMKVPIIIMEYLTITHGIIIMINVHHIIIMQIRML